MTKRNKATALNARAMRLRDKGQLAEAIELYHQAVAADPSWAAPLYNLGLLFKGERKWGESLEWNRRATALDKKNEAAWWNLGIAATALGQWDQARAAWRGFGIDVPEGDGPLDFPCGYCPIRINPDGDAEVVWADRIDPARAVLDNIPFPESGHRWGDVVLNDGAPNGYRKFKGQDVPVFDALALLEPSLFDTYVARIQLPEQMEDVARLAKLAAELGGSAEDWSTSTRMLCKACSEGRPHQEHDADAPRPQGAHLFGIAARDRDHVQQIFDAWKSAEPAVRVESLELGTS